MTEVEKTIERLVGEYSQGDNVLLKLELERLVLLAELQGVEKAFKTYGEDS